MLRPVLLLAFLLTATCHAADPSCLWAGDERVVFLADFDDGPFAWKAEGNPYQIGTQFKLVEGGVTGKCWQGETKYGYLGYAGDNLPVEAGTVLVKARATAPDLWRDGQQHCFLVLPRTVSGMAGDKDQWPKRGLALSVRKTPENKLALIAHLGGDSWMRESKPMVLAERDVSGLRPDAWHALGLSWDFVTRRAWLIVDEQSVEVKLPADVTPYAYHALVVGNCERYELSDQEPCGALLDDVAVLKVALPEVNRVITRASRLTIPRPPVPTRVAKATLFPDDPKLAQFERVARQHLDMLVENQRHGAWCLSIKWPSLMQFTAKYRLPEPASAIWLSKDGHTAFGAAQMLFAYEALGDERYLQAARNTCEMYLATQDPQFGYWVHGYFYENGKYIPASTCPLIQDHCQTGPIFLLAYMSKVTGEQKYLEAAKRCCEFLLRAQNPNGSWAHHWDPEKKVSVTSNGIIGGGEINDYGTSAPVATLLSMYRLTGEKRYREAALRGADWMVEALIVNDKVVGWAAQYDEKDQATSARHFEPASVTNYAPRWAAMGLLAAYGETRDVKYLDPLKKTLAWFDANKTGGGWWWDYDIPTGRPIQMHQRKIYFMDDPAQMEEYVKVTGGRRPEPGNWVRVDVLKNEVAAVERNPEDKPGPVTTKESLARYVETMIPVYETTYLESKTQPFNKDAGLYTWDSESGQSTSLTRHQITRFCDLLMRARAARGDIRADHPYFRRAEAGVGWNKVLDK